MTTNPKRIVTAIMVAVFIIGAAGLIAYAIFGWPRQMELDNAYKTSEAYRDSMRVSRSEYAEAIKRSDRKDSTIEALKRAGDSAKVSRQPIQQRHETMRRTFDSLGTAAAVDSLDLGPIGF